MKKLSTQKGFTLVETLVAVTILMISIAGPLTIAYKSYAAALQAHDQVTASYLAQDALEYIKNVRDNNMLQGGGTSMLAGFSGCSESNPCIVDTLDGTITQTQSGGRLMKAYTASGYGHSGNTPTKFFRTFYVKILQNAGNPQLPAEARLTVVVKWNNGSITNQVLYENMLYNTIK